MSFVEALFHRNQKATLDLFTQLAQERDALERVARTSSIQQATQASHTRALMSAIAECTERQSTMERSIHAILGRRAEGEKRLREGIMEMFRVKEQHDRRLQHEIDDLFAASADILLQVRKIADGLSGIAADPPKNDMVFISSPLAILSLTHVEADGLHAAGPNGVTHDIASWLSEGARYFPGNHGNGNVSSERNASAT